MKLRKSVERSNLRKRTGHSVKKRAGHSDTERRRAGYCLSKLRREYQDAGMILKYGNRFELTVAVVLSAQCTDAKVNRVLPVLFGRYKNADELGKARLLDLEEILKPLGLFRSKARSIRGLARATKGRIPSTMEELEKLPGVGRKTANVVMTEGFHRAEGIAVDTHCRRLAQRLKLTGESDPRRIEEDLLRIFRKRDWGMVTHLFIAHGRKVCRSRRPDCAACVIASYCPSRREFLPPASSFSQRG